MTTASIIAIGSELLSGQITNRNSTWLSQNLYDLGIRTVRHLVVDDDIEEISIALASCSDCENIFVTGGLGPTTDDVTRLAIARYADLPLEYDESSWKHIEEIFTQRIGIAPPESNKQQCYFPATCDILENNVGTAHGFKVQKDSTKIWVLPGPPRELHHIWDAHIQNLIEGSEATLKVLKSFRTIGLGESAIQERVNEIDTSGFTIAYRAHAPYVETKILGTRNDKVEQLISEIRRGLGSFIYEEDDVDYRQSFCDVLVGHTKITIDDSGTRGALQSLLKENLLNKFSDHTLTFLNSFERIHDSRSYVEEIFTHGDDVDVFLSIAGDSLEGAFTIGLYSDTGIRLTELRSPYKGHTMRTRTELAVAALAIKQWTEWLGSNQKGLLA